ncbi:MAG: Wzz/FepE/Etk N-terminal domain-containing protein [Anaerolineae bacterium]|nr:Wzz/FepE/Etk N-terminal domain-containing protein [Anaerolineae bacterium]
MRIQDYITVLRRRGWIIVIAIVITCVSAFIFSKLQTPIYRSSVNVAIQLARPDLSLTQSAKQLLRSYASLMLSEKRADMVIQTLGLYMQPADLKNNVKIVADDSLLVIKIDVDNPDGDLANDIANTWAQLLIQWRDEQNSLQNKEDRVFAEVIDPATYHLLRPKMSINLAAGAFLGFVLGTLVVFALEWLEAGVIHNPKTIESETGLTVIGVIPPVAQSKTKE